MPEGAQILADNRQMVKEKRVQMQLQGYTIKISHYLNTPF